MRSHDGRIAAALLVLGATALGIAACSPSANAEPLEVTYYYLPG